MKISYNWLCDYLKSDLTANQMAQVLTNTGLEVEHVDMMEAVTGSLEGVVVGEIVECVKHPDADRLNVTKVDIGNSEILQIVCGAPNVAQGQMVLVATSGAKLYPKHGESFVIKKSKIRGVESNGMICAEDELGIGESHAGIMVLPAQVKSGTKASDVLNLKTDYCLEIGITPNRTDALSHFGVARDLAAALNQRKESSSNKVQLSKPSVDSFQISDQSQLVSVEVNAQDVCPRYSGVTLKNVKVGPSPEWLQLRLNAIGLRSINNVVDITNYVQHEIGQPLHAFDLDKIEGRKIVVRMAAEGEKFTTLDGTERNLSADDLMICNSKNPMCIAGVLGGLDSGVTEKTDSIFIESAYFNPVNVRKTARRHGIHSDASFRFERGCDYSQTTWALKRAAQLIEEFAGGTVSSPVVDVIGSLPVKSDVNYRWNKTNKLIGKELDKAQVKQILKNLDFEIIEETTEGMLLTVPEYRADVRNESDVVEEILRIYGYDNIEAPHTLRSSLSISPKPDPEKIQNAIADFLASIGFNEMMGLSLTGMREELNIIIPMNSAKQVELLNPLSNDLAVMRQTLLTTAMECVVYNQNFRNTDLRLFEFGKTYHNAGKTFYEETHLSLVITGSKFPESWNNPTDEVSFMDLKGVVENICTLCGLSKLNFASAELPEYEQAVTYSQGDKILVTCGKISDKLLKHYGIKQPVYYSDVHWDALLNALPKTSLQYKQLEKYPSVRRDLSLLLNEDVQFSEIKKTALNTDKKLLRSVNLFDVYQGKNLAPGKKSYAISFILQDSSKTLTDDQVDGVMNKIQQTLTQKFGAELRA